MSREDACELAGEMADLVDHESDYATFELDRLSKDGEEVYPTRWWTCSKCGEEVIMMYYDGEPVACPYCGARNAKAER